MALSSKRGGFAFCPKNTRIRAGQNSEDEGGIRADNRVIFSPEMRSVDSPSEISHQRKCAFARVARLNAGPIDRWKWDQLERYKAELEHRKLYINRWIGREVSHFDPCFRKMAIAQP
jgi:hypothetical protein